MVVLYVNSPSARDQSSWYQMPPPIPPPPASCKCFPPLNEVLGQAFKNIRIQITKPSPQCLFNDPYAIVYFCHLNLKPLQEKKNYMKEK